MCRDPEPERQRPAAQPAAAPPKPTRVLTAWFNPWAYQSAEQIWSGLARTIVEETAQQIGDDRQQQEYWLARNLRRLDAAEIRRTLRTRIWRPAQVAALALLAPVVAALTRDWTTPTLLATVSVVGAVLLLVTARAGHAFFRSPATTYLPPEILSGSVLSGPFIGSTRREPPLHEPVLHDPLHHARSGQLYVLQQDVKQLVADLAYRGYQLVVFIDDVDRCSEGTTHELMGAINAFLCEQYPITRFVIGLDPGIVAARLRMESQATGHPLGRRSDDPHPGWAFLRKLSQLPIPLPSIRETHSTRLLKHHTPDTTFHNGRMGTSGPGDAQVRPPGKPDGQPPIGPEETGEGPGPDTTRLPGEPRPGEPRPPQGRDDQAGADQESFLEADPVVRAHLRKLIRLRPRQSARETKRLLTVWVFYVELFRHLLPDNHTTTAVGACNILTFAEIVTRWPALVPALGPRSAEGSGLRRLVAAAHDDGAWEKALREVGLDAEPGYWSPTDNLRQLLRAYGNDTVAFYAECAL